MGPAGIYSSLRDTFYLLSSPTHSCENPSRWRGQSVGHRMTWIYTTLCHLHRPGHSQSSMWHWMCYSSLNFKEFSATTSTIGADFRIYQGTHPKKLVGKKQNSKFVLIQKYLKSLSGLLIIGLLGAVSGRPVVICCIDHFLPWTYGPCHPHVARMLLL